MVASIGSSSVSERSNALFAKLDTKNQGYLDKTEIQAAFASTKSGESTAADNEAAAELFDALDVNRDSQVTRSELSSAVDKLASALNAQLDETRVAQGAEGARPAAPRGGGPAPAASATDAEEAYIAAADLDGNGSVSSEEAAAYSKQLEAEKAATAISKDATADNSYPAKDASGANSADGLGQDAAGEEGGVQKALQILKAYMDSEADPSNVTTSA